MAAKFFESKEDLQGAQADVLWESMTTNPHLPKRPILSVNQQLNTKNKRVISAVNELVTNTDRAERGVNSAVEYINKTVGNVAADPELKEELENSGGNVIQALLNTQEKVNKVSDDSSIRTICFMTREDVELGDDTFPIYYSEEEREAVSINAVIPEPGIYPVLLSVEQSKDYETWTEIGELLIEDRRNSVDLNDALIEEGSYLRVNIKSTNNDAVGLSVLVKTKSI